MREAGGSRHNSPPRHEIVDVPRESRIYIQMPGDHVLSGPLHYFINNRYPMWVLHPETINTQQPVAYVRMPNGQGLYSIMVPFHNGNNSNVQIYRCFIKTVNNTVFASFLHNNNNALNIADDARVFVRILGPQNPVFSGVLHRADGHPPAWLL